LNEQFESGNESNHVALSYRFDSIYSYTLFVDVICTYTRDNNEKPKLRTGKPQGDEKQTLPPQKKPILYSIKCIPYLFFFFFPSVEDIFLHHNALLFLRLTSCWRWGVGPLLHKDVHNKLAQRSTQRSSGNKKPISQSLNDAREPMV